VKGWPKRGPRRPGLQLRGAVGGVVRLVIIFVCARRLKKRLVRKTALLVTNFLVLLVFYLLWELYWGGGVRGAIICAGRI